MTPELRLLNKYVIKICPFIISIDSVEIAEINRFSDGKRLIVNIRLSAIHYCEIHNPVTEKKLIKYLEYKTRHIFRSIISNWDGKIITFRFFPNINITYPTIIEELNIVEEVEESPF